MRLSNAARSSCRHAFRSRHAALWLIVVGLLLRSAVPMLAATAAQWRGVGVADVCPVYGVQTLPVPVVAMSTMGPMPAAHGGHAHHHFADSGEAAPDHARGQGHEHHQDTASAHDHCVLTPLLGAAAVAAAAATLLQIAAGAQVHLPGNGASTSPHDASRRWYALDAHPPPLG